jgi:hypothetical protein
VAPDTFDFNSSVVVAPSASIVATAWTFGDGTTATGTSVSHQFALPGTFSVVLTVTDSNGSAGNASVVVAAAQSPTTTPTATPTTPTTTPTPPTTTPVASDFDTRKSAAGVIRWFDFDSAAQLGGTYGANFGTLAGTSTAPVIDSTVKSSGTGSLRFDIPPLSGSNAAGSWFTNFSSDLLTQFGENSQFFVQWRQRFNQAFIDTYFTQIGGSPQGGIKQVILGTGDKPGGILYSSCTTLETVLQTYYQHKFPITYNSCTGSASHVAYSPMFQSSPPYDFLLQNADPPPGCTYSQAGALGATGIPPGCFAWVANEWLTFQMGITLGPRDGNGDFSNSRVQVWAARDGKPSQLILDWKPGVPGYFPLAGGSASENQSFGKIWLLPYMTNKDPTQMHLLAQTWYDELIISKQQIPDPVYTATTSTPTSTPVSGPVSTPTPTSIPSPNPIVTLATLAGLSANTAVNLGNFWCNQPADNPSGCERSVEYGGMAYDPYNRRMLQFGGGHATTTRTDISAFDLSSLVWTSLYPSTQCSQMTYANYNASNGSWISTGQPVARHTYDMLVVGQFGTQRSLFMMTDGGYDHVEGCGGSNLGSPPNNQVKIAKYDLSSGGGWTYSSVSPGNYWYYAAASAYDPISQRIVVVGQPSNLGPGNIWIYDPATDSVITGNQSVPNISYAGNLVYFPPSDKFYYISNGLTASATVFEVTLNRSNYAFSTIAQVTGVGGSIPSPFPETGFAYDSKNQIIGGGIQGGTFFAYDPIAKRWSSSAMQTSPAGGSVGTLDFHVLNYDPVNNVFIFFTDYNSGNKTWAYRYQ